MFLNEFFFFHRAEKLGALRLDRFEYPPPPEGRKAMVLEEVKEAAKPK